MCMTNQQVATKAASFLVLTLLLVALAGRVCSGSPLGGRARRQMRARRVGPTAAFLPTRAAATNAKNIDRKDAEGGSISPVVERLRRALLHVLYMVSASEVLTGLSLGVSHLCGASMISPTLIIVILNELVWELWNRVSGNIASTKILVSIEIEQDQKKVQEQLDQKEWMYDHFTCNQDPMSTDRAERPHTVLTAAFSQKELSHLMGNMMSLSLFAPWVLACLGTYRRFFYFYVGSIYVSRFISDFLLLRVPEERHWNSRLGVRGWVSRQLHHFLRHLSTTQILGASGAVSANEMFFYLSFCWCKLGAACLVFPLLHLLQQDVMCLLHNTHFGTALGHNVGYRDHVGGQLFGTFAWLLACRLGIISRGQNFTVHPLIKWVWRFTFISMVFLNLLILLDFTSSVDWPDLLCLWRQRRDDGMTT